MMNKEEEKTWTPEDKEKGLSLLIFPIYAYLAFEGCGELYDFFNRLQPIRPDLFILMFGAFSIIFAFIIRFFIKLYSRK
jgi:hypothetical protein